MRRLVVALVLALLPWAPQQPAAAAPAGTRAAVPVWAYYYIWFNASSWNRAKKDVPAAGRYSSDEQSVMRTHVRAAKAAGITGFLVSWKSTPVLDARLDKLLAVAREEHFELGIVYQGLDVTREPLPVARVESDLLLLSRRWARDPALTTSGAPLVVWAGTWRFSAAELARVSRATRPAIRLLASERDTARWPQLGPLLDGNAYYWSSLDPQKDRHAARRLRDMGAEVHATGGLWIAPVAPGFDARLLGGRREVTRKDGDTLRAEWNLAAGSSPDAMGIISWNEFSESTNVEPGRVTGDTALRVLASLTGAPGPQGELDSSAPVGRGSSGPWRLGLIAALLLGAAVAGWRLHRTPRSTAHAPREALS